jgi:hypothetical protein
VNQATAFAEVIALRASATAASNPSAVRALRERTNCLTFDEACSMGFKSGE